MKVLLVLFALFTYAHAYYYVFNVTAQLGSQHFDRVQNATVKLALEYANEKDDFEISTGDLLPSGNFTKLVRLASDPRRIRKAAFYWTQPEGITNTTSQLSTPSPKFTKKSAVFLDQVTITGYIHYRLSWLVTMKFSPVNPALAIGHKQKVDLKLDSQTSVPKE